MKTTNRIALDNLRAAKNIIADREINNRGKASQLWTLAMDLPEGHVARRTILRQMCAVRDGLYPAA